MVFRSVGTNQRRQCKSLALCPHDTCSNAHVLDSLTAAQLKQLAHEKECVRIFEWLKTTVPYLAEVVPLMIGRGKDIMLIGRFVRFPLTV